jgi:hypothetical protein
MSVVLLSIGYSSCTSKGSLSEGQGEILPRDTALKLIKEAETKPVSMMGGGRRPLYNDAGKTKVLEIVDISTDRMLGHFATFTWRFEGKLDPVSKNLIGEQQGRAYFKRHRGTWQLELIDQWHKAAVLQKPEEPPGLIREVR